MKCFARILWAFTLLLPAACSTPEYRAIPFLCAGGVDAAGECPQGYGCRAGYCVSDDAGTVPALLDRSAADFVPTLQQDVDRGGLVACWIRSEDEDNAAGGIYGRFIGADGTVHPEASIQFAQFDTRGRDYRAACAPIPHSGGAVLIAAWFQSAGVARMDLSVWRPDASGDTGSAQLFYSEVSPNPSNVLLPDVGGLALTIVGDQVWVPYQQTAMRASTEHVLPAHQIVRLRVGAAELAAGAPQRDIIVPRSPQDDQMNIAFTGTDGGAWLSFGRFFRSFGFYPAAATGTVSSLRPILPTAGEGLGVPLVASGTADDATSPPRLAALWQPAAGGSGVGLRVAWITAGATSVPTTFTDLLPFTRLDTPHPAAMQVGDDVFLFGAPGGGSVLAAADGGLDGGLTGSDAAVTAVHAPLTMYRTHWGDAASFTEVRTLPRTLGDTAVTSIAAQPMGGMSFGLAWVEFYPPDSVGHGARYALYLQKF